MTKKSPTLLVILDGWGHREASHGNAIHAAHTPNWDHLLTTYPHSTLSASAEDVGLPQGQMGNSEVGHLTMGAGRIHLQDLVRLNQAVKNKTLSQNKALLSAIKYAKAQHKPLHVLGLFSAGGVHSHQEHILEVLKLAESYGIEQIFCHAFLDGRDTHPKVAKQSIELFTQQFKNSPVKLATLCGRFFAMDRDKRWDRIEKAFNMLQGRAPRQDDPISAIESAYTQQTDEFVEPVICAPDFQGMHPDDAFIFMNFRADRMRQICHAFCDKDFDSFNRPHWHCPQHMITLTEYEANLPVQTAFPPIELDNVLGKVIEDAGLSQLRIAETEKYAHVTYFFNGGIDTPFQHESRVLIPSPKVKTYDECPAMSAKEVTRAVIDNIKHQQDDVIICNFANADMVGHTGNFAATVAAIEALDECLGEIITELTNSHGQALITADHGNADCMLQGKNDEPHTAHTTNVVPCVYVGKQFQSIQSGTLADIAPTLLKILGLSTPTQMTGMCLLE